MTCTLIAVEDGETTMSTPDALMCCMVGLNTDDAALKMACEDTETFTWDEDSMTCMLTSVLDGETTMRTSDA